jgi:hypothetical protein
MPRPRRARTARRASTSRATKKTGIRTTSRAVKMLPDRKLACWEVLARAPMSRRKTVPPSVSMVAGTAPRAIRASKTVAAFRRDPRATTAGRPPMATRLLRAMPCRTAMRRRVHLSTPTSGGGAYPAGRVRALTSARTSVPPFVWRGIGNVRRVTRASKIVVAFRRDQGATPGRTDLPKGTAWRKTGQVVL